MAINREKVIKGLECHAEVNCVECPYRDGWRTCPFGETLLADAIALLKEQEAVEPYSMNAERTYGICPQCGKIIFRYGNVEENHYCGVCGKAVKWN